MQAAYFVCLAWGMEPSARNINEMVRRITTNGKPGRGFRHGEICEWLRSREPLGNQAGTGPEPPTEHKNATLGTIPEQAGNPSRAPHKVLESEPKLLLGVVATPPAAPKKPVRQIGLGLGRDETIAASGLCGALWTFLAPDMQAITQTEWRKRNMSAARDMVRAGVTIETFEAGAEAFRERRGYYPKAVKWLQEFLANGTPSKARVDSCGCALPPGVVLPKLAPNETVHWDGEEFLFGDVRDPKARAR